MREIDYLIYTIFGLLSVFFVIVLLIDSVQTIKNFSQELRSLNQEIARCSGCERRYWLRRRRRLWLSLLPFVKY